MAKHFPFPLRISAFVHNKNHNMTSALKCFPLFSPFMSVLGPTEEG